MGSRNSNREGASSGVATAAAGLSNGEINPAGNSKHLLITGSLDRKIGGITTAWRINGAGSDPSGDRVGILVFRPGS